MTTNAFGRLRSKSIANVFECTEEEEDKEGLLPDQWKDPIQDTLNKWKSSLNLNSRKDDVSVDRTRRSRANSIFTRPPSKPRAPRRQSLAEVFRRPSGLKDDIKRIWEKRPSLTGIRAQIRERMGRSTENVAVAVPISNPVMMQSPPAQYADQEFGPNDVMIPSFFIVDRSAWTLPSGPVPSAN